MGSIFDNWSFLNAYKNRYGHIELDLDTGERKPKKSAKWIKEVISNSSFEVTQDDIKEEVI